MTSHLQSGIGIVAILGAAWLFSEDRRAFPLRTVAAGLVLQVVLALLLLDVPVARNALFALNGVVDALTQATRAGTSFVFGYVGGGTPPFAPTNQAGLTNFAFQILPLVIVISALAALLWHWRILPVIVRGFAFVLRKLLGIGGAVGLGAAATIFLGMIEAPLLIRPYLARLSRSELFMLFTVGLSTVAGTVFVLYASILQPVVPGALGHILVASMLSLPGGILIGRIMVPGKEETEAVAAPGFEYRSSMDAVARGTADGLQLWLGIVAMLLVMVALVALADIILKHLPQVAGAPLTAERIFGWAFAPFVWLIGIPWKDAATAGSLMGDKTILNEFVAYLKLAALPANALDPRSRLIMLYAMCGFANFGSVGILIAGVGGLVPERRSEIVPLALRALVSGTMASALTGAIIGLLPVG
ncbi:MAG TPA: nucleoside transporter C-terminal domain-containing protein [Rhizomicrobium sp.]|jgi:CNT family concentrative nucleoside transporter|nr:nucleoside transporter C-terminal domain-containing protein [Rhizomicrobium sp.]